MVKIDIISGFLGAGKTTLINRLITEIYKNEKIVLIENEFGEIGIDSGFLKESGVQISEMNSGCICCSLVGDFSKALKQVVDEYAPERILIEPSGVGKLSDVKNAVETANIENAVLNSAITVVDVNKCKMYMRNFGEFFNNQISNADCIIFSHTDKTTSQKLEEALALVRSHNENASIVTTATVDLSAQAILNAIEGASSIQKQLEEMLESEVCPECGHAHHHHHHDHDHDCECHHEHHHEHHHAHEHECHHEHHHKHEHEHEHHHDCECHHEHHHEHEHHHDCECHHEHSHHHHHADDVFTSWGRETAKAFSVHSINEMLEQLKDEERFGMILRAKGIVASENGKWLHFDYVPGEADVRFGASEPIGKICVIGSAINENELSELFGV